ncbi:MAG: ABC transporter permease [Clostridiales bacterium]|nr:ABC transporter permease [Clostridiales bacterium]
MRRYSNIVSKYAKRTVFANKGRSILTLIGIVIATTMFCIVSSAYVSAFDILKSFASDEYGKWHVEAYSMTAMDFQKVMKDPRIENVAYIQELGYNLGNVDINYDDSGNYINGTPYDYFIAAMSPNFADICHLSLVRGRLPENSGEAIISLEMFSDDRENLALGTKIEMDTYARYSDGHKVMNLEYLSRDKTGKVSEQLYAIDTKEYTIVGYFVVPEYAKWKNIAKNTILTTTDAVTAGSAVNAYFEFTNPEDYINFTEDNFKDEDECLYNKDFIRMENSADDTKVERGFGLIAFAVIAMTVLLAVMLIYNSFSTSSSERIRAIGLLKSAGATRSQVKELLLYEAFYYSIIGIPIGIVLGQVSSFFLFNALTDLSRNAANYFILKNIDLQYRLSYQNTLGPAVLAVLTIFVAIILPMKHVSKVSPMEAVRANESFEEGKNKKHFFRRATRIFGFTGGLSMKNYIRYRKRYLATVISIMASVFMILFANMLVQSVNSRYQVDESGNPDAIIYTRNTGKEGFTGDDRAMFYQLASIEGVKTSRMEYVTSGLILFPLDILPESLQETALEDAKVDSVYLELPLVFIDDATWRELCTESGIDPEPYLEYGSRLCLINNKVRVYSENGEYLRDEQFMSQLPEEIYLDLPDGLSEKLHIDADVNWDHELALEESFVQVYLPMSRLEYYRMEQTTGYELFQFTAKKPVRATSAMKEMLESNLYLSDTLVDAGIYTRARHAVNSLVRIIMYGYVGMLSFMCFLNVIMTVISNIVFRRKEYILLMSVGMSRKTLFRMVISESFIYFFESAFTLAAILYISVGMAALIIDSHIYRYINHTFFLVVLFLHLFVVVSTTAIGLSRIMRDEIIEGIRKDYY